MSSEKKEKKPVKRRTGPAPPIGMSRRVDTGANKEALAKLRASRKGLKASAYCVKCRKKQPMAQPYLTKSSGGRKMIKGKCSMCNRKTNLFVREDFEL